MLLSRRRSASLVCVTAFAVMSAAPSYGASLEVAPTTLRVNADSGALVASAKTVLVWFDYDREKPAPLDDATKTKLSVPVAST